MHPFFLRRADGWPSSFTDARNSSLAHSPTSSLVQPARESCRWLPRVARGEVQAGRGGRHLGGPAQDAVRHALGRTNEEDSDSCPLIIPLQYPLLSPALHSILSNLLLSRPSRVSRSTLLSTRSLLTIQSLFTLFSVIPMRFEHPDQKLDRCSRSQSHCWRASPSAS